MVEQSKDFTRTREFNTIGSWIGALGTLVMLAVVLLGWLTTGNNNVKDIQTLQGQVLALTTQVANLANKIDQGPQSLQMHEFDRHLSALDGRMDGMDTRVRGDEQALTRVQTEVESIRASSGANLGRSPR